MQSGLQSSYTYKVSDPAIVVALDELSCGNCDFTTEILYQDGTSASALNTPGAGQIIDF